MKYFLSIIVTIILFSTVEVIIKLLNGNIDMLFLAFLRFFISGIIIGIIGIRGIIGMEKKDMPVMFWLGFAGVTLALGAFNLSLKYVEASRGAVIFSINPIFTALFAAIFSKEKLKKNNVLGIILGFAGVWILNFGFRTVEFKDMKGPALMLIAAVGFAYYIVMAKKYVSKYGAFAVTGIIFVSGALMYLPLINSFEIKNIDSSWVYIAYLSIVATGIAYLCYFYGLQHVSTVAGASLFYLKPIIASLLSVVVLGEILKPDFYAGLALIITSLTFTIYKPAKKKEIL